MGNRNESLKEKAKIISASRRTDLPAFYSEWFINRVREGFFESVNPFNPRQRKTVGLRPEDVTAFVFWSKNPAPLMKYLPEIELKGYRYYFQFTLNDYPKVFEPRVPVVAERIELFQRLVSQIGPEKVVWRYDPIIISNITPASYHVEHFGRLAEQLRGYSGRVMISFLDQYHKVKQRLKVLAQETEIEVSEIRSPENLIVLSGLVRELSRLAGEYNLEIYSCAEEVDLVEYGVKHGSCIDGALLNKLFDINIPLKKDRSQRSECGCVPSVDMGVYNTCKFNCRYCYANGDEQAVNKNATRHNPGSPVLLD